jgi:hypothetical protein
VSNIPAGWHPDPAGSPDERYWDGLAWTNDLRPVAPAAPVWAPPAMAASPTYQPAVGAPVYQPSIGPTYAPTPSWQQTPEAGQPNPYSTPNPYSIPNPFESFANGATGQSLIQGAVAVRRVQGVMGGVWLTIFGVVFFTINLVMSGLIDAQSEAPAGSVTTMGHIVSLGAGSPCTPIVEYDVAGQTETVRSSLAISPCPWHVGEQLEVAYDPASPATSGVLTTVNQKDTWMRWLFGGVSGLMIVGGVAIFIRRLRG